MQTEKTLYEITYLIASKTPEDQVEGFIKSIEELVSGLGAENIVSQPFQKIRLSYPIKKENDAYLAVILFLLAGEKAKELAISLEKQTNILRYLLVKKQPVKPEQAKKEKPKKPKVQDDEFEAEEIDEAEEVDKTEKEAEVKEEKKKTKKKTSKEASAKKPTKKASKEELDAIDRDLDEILGK